MADPTPLDYATPQARPPRRLPVRLSDFVALAALFSVLGCVVAVGIAIDQYSYAADLPARRVTALEKVDRLVTRAVQGRRLTYASAPLFYAVLIVELARASALGAFIWQAVSRRNDAAALRRTAWAVLLSSIPVLLAWFWFLRNVVAVQTAFAFSGTFVNKMYLILPVVLIGNAAGSMLPLLFLLRPRAPDGQMPDAQ